jgi:hypothetical protein
VRAPGSKCSGTDGSGSENSGKGDGDFAHGGVGVSPSACFMTWRILVLYFPLCL